MCSPYSLKPRGGSRVWNEPTLLLNDLTIEMNDLTWSNMTIEQNDRKPFQGQPLFFVRQNYVSFETTSGQHYFLYSLWLILKTRAILSMKTKTTQPLRNFIEMFSCGIFLLCSNWSWCRIINFEALILIFLPYFFNLIDFPRRMFVHAMWEWRRMRSWLYQRELHMRLSCWILRWYLQIR